MAASSVVRKGDAPMSLRDRVVMGMPAASAAARCEMPAARSRHEMCAEIARETVSGVAMWITLVTKWLHDKRGSGTWRYHLGDRMYQVWGGRDLLGMGTLGDNARERSSMSDSVAAQIRAERAALRVTQQQMADPSGLSRITVIRLENGDRVADTTQLARVCKAAGITLSEFFRRVEQRDGYADGVNLT